LTARGVAAPAALALLASMNQTRAAARLAAVAVQAARRTLARGNAADVVSSRTLEIAKGVMQAMSANKQKWGMIFCGQWCGPCRQMNPQKQRLVERYAGKPFALLEVNSDDDRETVRRTMRKEKPMWRCWFDGGREGAISRSWGVHSWPTLFILDGKGVIRFKELRGPMLNRVVERLMNEGEEPRPEQ
jgi:thiol-disulfide isomerase/thioredoxin